MTAAASDARSDARAENIFMRLAAGTALIGGRSRGIGKAFGGFAGGWVAFQKTVGVGQFQDAFDHPSGAGQAKSAAGGFQAGETIDDFSQATAVQFGELAEVKDNLSLSVAEQLVQGELQLLALDTHLERAAQLENHDPWLELFLDDVHEDLSERGLILKRMADNFQARARKRKAGIQEPGAPFAATGSSPS